MSGSWALRLAMPALCLCNAAGAGAASVDTRYDELALRADTTLRYNLGRRVEGQQLAILRNEGADDGDRNFGRGSLVNNRLDLLLEMDAVWRKRFGARLSMAGWYDDAYAGDLDNTSVATSNHLSGGVPSLGLAPYARRHYEGPSGEVLDAFVFGSFHIDDSELRLRAGRHTVIWGEALLGAGAVHGVTYAQSPLDQAKAFSSPGIEAKELYLPLAQLSASVQATPELSFAAQYHLEWEATRGPEAGTYLGAADALQFAGESLILAPGVRLLRGRDIEPRDRGDWGIAVRWSPASLNGTLGAYARRFTDRNPQLLLNTGAANEYLLSYAGGIGMLGVSLATQVGSASIGIDLNMRRNMPLASQAVAVIDSAAYPARGEVLGARGKTLHGVLNATGALGATPLFDSLGWVAELTLSRWTSVSQGIGVFKGRAGYSAIDRVSRNSLGLAVNVTPSWFQALPGIDMSMPVSYSVGLSGNSAVAGGGNKGAGSWAAGFALDIYNRHRIELKYVDYFGDVAIDANGAATIANGGAALLKDRGAVFLTVKTSF